MYLNEAKIKLLDAGYRIIKENSDVYSDIREILMDDGYSEEMVEDLMMKYNAEIEDLLSVDKTAFEIAANIEGYEEEAAEDETEEIELGGNRYGDYIDPDEYMEESKSNKQKTDKFERKAKLAGKKKACKDCDEDEDDELDEAIEDIEGLTRGPRGQQGTEDWSDFKDDFRAQTLILKKTLTPKFVSGLIKDMDFEIDSKDIKDVAVKMLEQVKDTKNPVENLQARIRKFFTK